MPQLSRLKQNLNQLFSFPNLWLVAIWGFVLLGVVSLGSLSILIAKIYG